MPLKEWIYVVSVGDHRLVWLTPISDYTFPTKNSNTVFETNMRSVWGNTGKLIIK